jgi:hypothetical protein
VTAFEWTTAPVVIGLAFLALLAVAAVWLIPKRQARRWAGQGIQGKELADLEVSSRGTFVQIVGGVALILTFVATWMQIADARKASDRASRLTQAQQETERFTRAVEQLGSKNFALRLGGIYGLERLALDSPRERGTVSQLMIAYLRKTHTNQQTWGLFAPKASGDELLQFRSWIGACRSTRQKPAVDTQAAIDVLRSIRVRGSALDLSGLDLTAVRMRGIDLSDADLRDSRLRFVHAENAKFDRADLERTDFTAACLADTSFRNAVAPWSRWVATDVSRADLTDMNEGSAVTDDRRGDECTVWSSKTKVPAGCSSPAAGSG